MEIVSFFYFVVLLLFFPQHINGVNLWGGKKLHTKGSLKDWHIDHSSSKKSSIPKSKPEKSFSSSSSSTGTSFTSSESKKSSDSTSFFSRSSSSKDFFKTSSFHRSSSTSNKSFEENVLFKSYTTTSSSTKPPATEPSSIKTSSTKPPSTKISTKSSKFYNPFFELAPDVELKARYKHIKKLASLISELNLEIKYSKGKFNKELVGRCVIYAHRLLGKDRVHYMDAVWPLGVLHGLNDYATENRFDLEEVLIELDYQAYLFLVFTTDLQDNIWNEVKKFTLLSSKESMENKQMPDLELVERCARARLFNHHQILKEEESDVPRLPKIEKILEKYLSGSLSKEKIPDMIGELIELVGDREITSWEKFFATEVCIHLSTYQAQVRMHLEGLIIQNSDFRLQFYMIYAQKNIDDYFAPCEKSIGVRNLLYKFENPIGELSKGDVQSVINVMNSKRFGIENRMRIHRILMAKSFFTPIIISVLLEEINKHSGIPIYVAEIWERIYTGVDMNGNTLADFEYILLKAVPGLVSGARRVLLAHKMLGRQSHQSYHLNSIAVRLKSLPWKFNENTMGMVMQLQGMIDDHFETKPYVDVMLFESYIYLISYHEACAFIMLMNLNLKPNFRGTINRCADQVLQDSRGASGVAPVVLIKFAKNMKNSIESLTSEEGQVHQDSIKEWAASLHKATAH
ncbi:hypothetical protein DFH28DRAFT_29756 [Melampsora americana]|nr:hypothetical protein DFH28DRAFT_29756 [Melampsora americana]